MLGAAQLNSLAAACRKAGNGMEKELVDGIQNAAKGLDAAIRANIPPTMPRGYEPVLAAGLQVKIGRQTSGVIVKVTAKGHKGLRDLPRIDAGLLRHPVYGRMRRTRRGWRPNPWVGQAVKPGVVTKPFNELEPKVLDELGKAVERIAQQIAGS